MVSLINDTSSEWFFIEGVLEKLIFEAVPILNTTFLLYIIIECLLELKSRFVFLVDPFHLLKLIFDSICESYYYAKSFKKRKFWDFRFPHSFTNMCYVTSNKYHSNKAQNFRRKISIWVLKTTNSHRRFQFFLNSSFLESKFKVKESTHHIHHTIYYRNRSVNSQLMHCSQ